MRALFSRKPSAGLAAVALTGERVEVAHVSRGAELPLVEFCVHVPVSPAEAPEALQKLRRELHLDRYRCSTLLPTSKYQMQLLDAPTVPDAELKSAVRWRLKDYLDYPVESATVDVLSVPSGPAAGRGRSVYAISARNQDIESCMKTFSAAKLGLEVIDIAEMAQRNLATLFEVDQRAIAMLSFGEDSGLLTFTAQGELYLTRHIEITRQQLLDAANGQREQLFDRIALELQRSLDHFDRQFSYVPLSRVLLAPLPADFGLADFLKGNLSATVEDVNLAEVLDLQKVGALIEPEEQMLRWLILGAALRGGSPEQGRA
jgi:MSHA biogenesis protein MshI